MIIQRADCNPELVKLGEAVHDALVFYNRMHGVWQRNLCGACGIGAYHLTQAAEQRGIPCTLHVRPNHAFCMSEGLIYDPTHTQFLHDGNLPDGYVKVGVYTQEDLQRLHFGGNYARYDRSIFRSYDTTPESIRELARSSYTCQRPNTYEMLWVGNEATLLKAEGDK